MLSYKKPQKKYDCIFSFGHACNTATMLNRIGLRKFSAPLDWVYGCDFQERFAMFLEGFPHFFDKKDLKFLETYKIGDRTTAVYKNTRTGIVFNHDFAAEVGFDSEYLTVAEKYARRISRLIGKINKCRRTLIVYAEERGGGSYLSRPVFRALRWGQ